MKKFIFTLAAICLMAVESIAQTTVKGVLMDKALNESEPYATIRIFKANKKDKPVAMFLSNENGHFQQEVKGNGTYSIVFSSVGKEDLSLDIELGKT